LSDALFPDKNVITATEYTVLRATASLIVREKFGEILDVELARNYNDDVVSLISDGTKARIQSDLTRSVFEDEAIYSEGDLSNYCYVTFSTPGFHDIMGSAVAIKRVDGNKVIYEDKSGEIIGIIEDDKVAEGNVGEIISLIDLLNTTISFTGTCDGATINAVIENANITFANLIEPILIDQELADEAAIIFGVDPISEFDYFDNVDSYGDSASNLIMSLHL